MEIGSKVTIFGFGADRTPGTVVGMTASGKTITVKKNKYEAEKRNHGPMILKIEKVHDELYSDEIKFRWSPEGTYWKRLGNSGYGSCREGWEKLTLDIGL